MFYLLKKILNELIHPTYGSSIHALEDYIKHLNNEGVTERNEGLVKRIIFKSNPSAKLRAKLNIAQQVKDWLIDIELLI